MSEKEFRAVVEKRLSRYFYLHSEQKGYWAKGDKMPKRLDLVVQHKEFPVVRFGIEFKDNELKKGDDLGAWCRQASNYSQIEWNFKTNAKRWGILPILICPNISLNYLKFIRGFEHDEAHDHNNVNSFLAKGFNIGEVRPMDGKDYDGARVRLLRFTFANKTLWREIGYGHEIADPHNYRKVFGLRDRVNRNAYGQIEKNNQTFNQKMKRHG